MSAGAAVAAVRFQDSFGDNRRSNSSIRSSVTIQEARGTLKPGHSSVSHESSLPVRPHARSAGKKLTSNAMALATSINSTIQRDFEEYNGRNALQPLSFITPSTIREITPGMVASLPQGGIAMLRFQIKKLVISRFFDMFIGIVILANSVTIGCELSLELEGKDVSIIQILEDIWLVIYVAELTFRVFAMGLETLRDNWVKFDAVLVFIGVMNGWVLPRLISEDSGSFGFFMVLRMMRLFRLARTMRLIGKFRVLWMLVRGLLTSAGTMFYTFILLAIVLYIFAAVGIELITNNPIAKQDAEFQEIVRLHFSSLSDTMLTLMQFVCMDSIGAIYRPLVQKDSTLLFYFTGVILVVPIVLMNLVTAILVNGALEQANADKEAHRVFEQKRKARLVKQLEEMFIRLDEDNSGQISREEILNIGEEDAAVLEATTSMGNPLEMFEALDVDETGTLSIEDFCDGVWKMATSSAAIEVQRMEKQVQVMFKRMKVVESNQCVTNDRLCATNDRLDKIQRGQDLILQLLNRSDRSLLMPPAAPSAPAAPAAPAVPAAPSIAGSKSPRSQPFKAQNMTGTAATVAATPLMALTTASAAKSPTASDTGVVRTLSGMRGSLSAASMDSGACIQNSVMHRKSSTSSIESGFSGSGSSLPPPWLSTSSANGVTAGEGSAGGAVDIPVCRAYSSYSVEERVPTLPGIDEIDSDSDSAGGTPKRVPAHVAAAAAASISGVQPPMLDSIESLDVPGSPPPVSKPVLLSRMAV